MTNEVTVNLSGLLEVEQRLIDMGPEIGFKAARSGLMKASLPMFKAAKRNALAVRDSGALAMAMGRWSRKAGRSGTGGRTTVVAVQIGPRSKNKRALALWNAEHKQKRPARALRHAHLAEYGSASGRATPYLRPAFRSTADQVVRNFGKETQKAIMRFGAKQTVRR